MGGPRVGLDLLVRRKFPCTPAGIKIPLIQPITETVYHLHYPGSSFQNTYITFPWSNLICKTFRVKSFIKFIEDNSILIILRAFASSFSFVEMLADK